MFMAGITNQRKSTATIVVLWQCQNNTPHRHTSRGVLIQQASLFGFDPKGIPKPIGTRENATGQKDKLGNRHFAMCNQ